LNASTVAAGVVMAVTPGLFAAGPHVEGWLWPVTGRAVIESEEPGAGSVTFDVAFEKWRACEFLGLAWYDGDRRIAVRFPGRPAGQGGSPSRPVGDQVSAGWRLDGVERLAGTRAVALHRCHPLWITVTPFHG
jgi:hypothetical protein